MKRLVFLSIISFLFSTSLWADQAVCRVISVEGPVLVQENPQAQWKPLEVDQALGEQATIKTDAAASTHLAFEGSSDFEVDLAQNSQAQIKSLSDNKKWFLDHGRIYVETEGLNASQSFEVQTPSAVAAVRGTQWEVEHMNNQTDVNAFENTVTLQALDEQGHLRGKKMLVNAGFGSRVRRHELPEISFRLSPERLTQWKARREKMNTQMERFDQGHPGRFKRLVHKKSSNSNRNNGNNGNVPPGTGGGGAAGAGPSQPAGQGSKEAKNHKNGNAQDTQNTQNHNRKLWNKKSSSVNIQKNEQDSKRHSPDEPINKKHDKPFFFF